MDKKLALGVKRKQLKRKNDRGLDGAVESERAAEHGIVEGITSDFFLLFPPISFWVVLNLDLTKAEAVMQWYRLS